MAVNGLAHTAELRRILGWHDSPGYFSIKTVFLYGIAFILISPGIVHYNKAQQITEGSVSRVQNESGRICESMDIRNSLQSFAKLGKCEVIEGFLQILLFDSVNETELSKMSFPLLTEITDYLLLYRVNGLRSIGHLFPNLAVIRGQNTFLDNTFVIFEMSTLQEIGLYSLTDITHGSVRIDKNPSLCFVHTVDWNRIVHDKTERNFVKSLKPENECPICPSHIDGMTSENNSISVSCPEARRTNSDIFEKDKFLCWNKKHCQKVCPSNCSACNNNGECCHSSCLACSDEDKNLCTVCRKYSIGFGKGKQCMQNCPKGLVGYLDRRCISPEECKNMPRPIELHATSDPEKPYKVHKNSCILHCPPDHTDNYKHHTCDPCGGRCNKTCDGINIDSITVAKQLRGCTHIKGALEIQIRGGANVTELEENLGMIEEISDYLKVVRSFSLISLSFLKSLKRIRGMNLEKTKFVFIVLDNQNLQELWDWHNRTLQIDRGTFYFHFNPKLCMNKIEKLRQITGLAPFSNLEVEPNSNGDKTACNIKPLKVNVTNITNKSVTLKWEPFHMDDQRKLLAYIVYIREAPHRDVTLYGGRDACGLDDWRVVDVPNQEDEHPIDQPLPSLKPYTQYAFYVRTYTIASERNGSQSEIQYFRTLPSMPSPPVNLQVFSSTSDSLMITWSSPVHPYGQITHYIVSGKKHQNGYMFTKDCQDEKKYSPTVFPKEEHPLILTTAPPKKDTCQCDDNRQIRISIDEQEELARIKFEDKLHNEVYQKRPTKKKRSSPEFPKNANKLQVNLYNQIQNVTENGTDIWESFNFPVYGQNNFTIRKLHHFTLYDINVQACRRIEGENDKDSPCSSTSMQTYRTLSKRGAEDIGKIKITNQSMNSVTISWEQPEDPNGQIFMYSVEYRIIDIENSRPYSECVNAKDKNKTVVYTISKLYAGNYSLVVIATSSGGTGTSPTIYFYIKESTSHTVLIVCGVLLVFLIVLFVAGWLYWKNLKEERIIRDVNPEYVPSVYIPDEWEVQRKKIDLIKELGQGSFGMVWEGLAHDIRGKSEIRCAVKTVNEHATDRERLEFLNEASVMKAFDTAHVVRLLGVVSQEQPTLVIMELMANGDLKSYLRSHRPDVETYNPNIIKHPPSLKQILKMAIEIADGMAYLSAKKFVHRDLAARNCMVSEDLTVKIGDFGMTRDIYETDYYRKGTKGLLPVRWMAPESLKDGVFASNSDVWSYGVVLWEMATLASQPYQGLSNDQVLRYVIDGGVMERPENCPDKLYTLMRYCWQHKPTSRPSFLKLCQLLLDDASPTYSKVSFYHSPVGVETRTSRPIPSPSQDEQTTPLRKITEKLRGYTPSHSQDSDELDIDTHHQFPGLSESGVGVITTANGYVSGCPTNGAATTQC